MLWKMLFQTKIPPEGDLKQTLNRAAERNHKAQNRPETTSTENSAAEPIQEQRL